MSVTTTLKISLRSIFLFNMGTIGLLLLSMPSLGQSSIKIPKDLEIVIGNLSSWHGGVSKSRFIIRPDRVVESSSYCTGCLPRGRDFAELLSISPGNSVRQSKNQAEKRKKDEKRRPAALKKRVPKSTIKLILLRIGESDFYKWPAEAAECDNWSTSGRGSSSWISLKYKGFSRSVSISKYCAMKDRDGNQTRKEFFALYDFISRSLSNTRKLEVPWMIEIERLLNRALDEKRISSDLEIVTETDEGGMGTRLRLMGDGHISQATYSKRTRMQLGGIEIDGPSVLTSKQKKPPKFKKRVAEKRIRSILSSFISTGFFNMPERLHIGAFVSGPSKYTMISIRVDGLVKQTKCERSCLTGTGSGCVEFCRLNNLIQDSVIGVTTAEEPW